MRGRPAAARVRAAAQATPNLTTCYATRSFSIRLHVFAVGFLGSETPKCYDGTVCSVTASKKASTAVRANGSFPVAFRYHCLPDPEMSPRSVR